jgi:hypothetical protein
MKWMAVFLALRKMPQSHLKDERTDLETDLLEDHNPSI